MIKLKIIAIFLSMLMLMQMLPVEQIGQALGQSIWTEELPHNDEAGKEGNYVFNNPFLPPPNFTTINSIYAESKAMAYIHTSEQIPSNHSTEVVSPPPDLFI